MLSVGALLVARRFYFGITPGTLFGVAMGIAGMAARLEPWVVVA